LTHKGVSTEKELLTHKGVSTEKVLFTRKGRRKYEDYVADIT
jgi:hypothetical protein